MKNFVKAMDREVSGFAFLPEKFPQISMEKLKTSIFDGPQIRELTKDQMFDKALSEAELAVLEVSSYKLPGEPTECGIREGN